MSDAMAGLGGVPLYRHARREQWGLAILALEEGDRRRYQFEDGRMRTFKKGYWHLLVEVSRPVDEARSIVGDLISKLDVSQARRELIAEARTSGKDVLTLDDQVAIFKHLYEGGFEDERWTTDFRGNPEGRRLKRHRESAILAFQEGLSAEARAELRAENGARGLLDGLVALLKSTDLIRRQDLVALETAADEANDAVANAFDALIESPMEHANFAAWVDALGPKVTWALATVPIALVFPFQHIAVKPSTFKAQAKWLAPRLEMSSEVVANTYKEILVMSSTLKEGLEARELKARDLLDIHDFVVQTLRPSSIKSWRGAR